MTRMRLALCLIGMFAVALLGATAQAAPPEPFTLEVVFHVTGPDTAEGDFEIYDSGGDLVEWGDGSETFRFSPPAGLPRTAHGIKTLVGQNGDIFIRFQGRVTIVSPTEQTIEGQFVIVGGTEEYENLHGTGAFTATAIIGGPTNITITGTYTGCAQFDNRRSSR